MSKQTLLFLDTETTGNMPSDRLCQLCYKLDDKIVNELYKPPVPISIESMAIHHITTKMVEEKPAFTDSPEYSELKGLLECGAILIAHNAKFDIGMIEKEGLTVPNHIDTYRVARHLDTESKIPSYRLQYLRYFLGIVIDATAHDAKGDVLVLEQLFDRLITKIMEKENLTHEEAIDAMIRISSEPVTFTMFNFGKHKGKAVTEVIASDRNYCMWLLAEKRKNPADEEDWIYTLEKALNV